MPAGFENDGRFLSGKVHSRHLFDLLFGLGVYHDDALGFGSQVRPSPGQFHTNGIRVFRVIWNVDDRPVIALAVRLPGSLCHTKGDPVRRERLVLAGAVGRLR